MQTVYQNFLHGVTAMVRKKTYRFYKIIIMPRIEHIFFQGIKFFRIVMHINDTALRKFRVAAVQGFSRANHADLNAFICQSQCSGTRT